MPFQLTVQPRSEIRSKVKSLRDQKLVPAILYGVGIKENQNIQVSAKEFDKTYSQAGENQVVELTVEGKKPTDVLIREVQIDPVRRHVIHADFQAIDINKDVFVDIPFEFTGIAPAVKASGGSLIKKLQSLSVKCKPKDLVANIEVPLGVLETLEDVILVENLSVPKAFEIQGEIKEVVATVVPPRIEVEPTSAETAEGEEKPEGEEGAEPQEGEEKAEDGKEEEGKEGADKTAEKK